MAEIVKRIAPMAWEAFEDYQLYGEHFSKMELSVLADHLRITNITKESLRDYGLTGLEADEFLDKIQRLKLKK
jgi:hypothetical protein